jgi:hypothetical protein
VRCTGAKVWAATAWPASSDSAQSPLPLQSPLQRTVVAPSVASMIDGPVNCAEHAVAPAPQSIPGGVEVTRPGPATATVTLREPAPGAPSGPLPSGTASGG